MRRSMAQKTLTTTWDFKEWEQWTSPEDFEDDGDDWLEWEHEGEEEREDLADPICRGCLVPKSKCICQKKISDPLHRNC